MTGEMRAALRHYVTILVVSWAAMLAAGILLGRYAGVSLPAGAVAILPPMIAAMVAGRRIGGETGIVPEGPAAWRFAGFGALIYLALQVLLAAMTYAALLRAGGGPPAAGLAFLLAMLCVVTAIAVLVNRLFLSVGARSVVGRAR